MFFIHFLEHVLTLHPTFFGSHVKEYLMQKLLDDVEGICTGDYYIVCVMDTYDISEGRVLPGSGLAEYTIMYRAIVWKPFKGETVDAIVTSVKNQGIFAEVGPLTVFVSKHLIPPEIKWDPDAIPPQYTDNGDQVIEKGTNLRIKLIGLRNDVRNMFAIGSIKEDYLGYDRLQLRGQGQDLLLTPVMVRSTEHFESGLPNVLETKRNTGSLETFHAAITERVDLSV